MKPNAPASFGSSFTHREKKLYEIDKTSSTGVTAGISHCIGDWPFHAHDRGIHLFASGTRRHMRGGCAHGAAFEAQPSVQSRNLARLLKPAGIGYVHIAELGGLRHTTRDSLNIGWRNASFRGYTDYMQTPEFQRAIDQLIQLANQDRIVVMCTEAVPWRCHRSLITDALLVRGIGSEDILSATRRQVHALTSFARVG